MLTKGRKPAAARCAAGRSRCCSKPALSASHPHARERATAIAQRDPPDGVFGRERSRSSKMCWVRSATLARSVLPNRSPAPLTPTLASFASAAETFLYTLANVADRRPPAPDRRAFFYS
jgi:hypothetical protein